MFFAYTIQPATKAVRIARIAAVGWTIFALAAITAALTIEESFSPFSHLQARYHPIIISTALGLRYEVSEPPWMQPTTIFILVLLCVTQTAADIAATVRWDAYVVDLRSRLAHGHGLIPWEVTLHTADERVDINWRLMNIGWVVPFNSVIFAPNGVVSVIIDSPIGTTFQPLNQKRPDHLPKLRGIDYMPYKRFLAAQNAVD